MLYFIVNKRSGSGRGALIWKDLCGYLKEIHQDYQAFDTEYAGHAVLLAQQICQQQDSEIRLIVLGGDGTVNEVLNGITDFDRVRLGLIPTGSGNDLARGLGIQRTPEELLRQMLESTGTESLDLGNISLGISGPSRLFGISSGIGMDAYVCMLTNTSRMKNVLNRFHLGKLSYLFITLSALFHMETASAEGFFDDGRPHLFQQMIFSAAMNFQAEGGGIPMSPCASAQDGKFSVCTVSGVPKWLTFFYLPLLAAGRHERLNAVNITDCTSFTLHADRPMPVHADGEYLGDYTDVHYECLPGKLKLIAGY